MFTYNYSTTSKNVATNSLDIFVNLYEDFMINKEKKISITDTSKVQCRVMQRRFFKFLEENEKYFIHTKNMDIDLFLDFFREMKNTSKPTSEYHRNIYYEIIAVFQYGMAKGLIIQNPLVQIDIYQAERKTLNYLTIPQVNYLSFVKLNPFMRTVADVFILQCYTGFSYADLMKFDYKTHYVVEHNGKDKIILHRRKSGVTCVIPVLPTVKRILRKYNNELPKKQYDYYLNMLDVIGGILNLPFKLTTHIGRKTAGVYLLNEGVSMEVVSKVLGHASILTTEKTYAVILNKRMDKEFEHLY